MSTIQQCILYKREIPEHEASTYEQLLSVHKLVLLVCEENERMWYVFVCCYRYRVYCILSIRHN